MVGQFQVSLCPLAVHRGLYPFKKRKIAICEWPGRMRRKIVSKSRFEIAFFPTCMLSAHPPSILRSSATWHKQQQTESDNGLAAFSHDSLINQSSIMLSRSLCVLALPILHVSPSQQVIKIQSPFTNLNVLSEITESDNGELITCVLNEWNQNFRKPAYEAGKRAQRIQTTKLI
ncbi:hypothetical protein T4B_8217 [Trichinella pseudospiralis]|uniref:Uncharacterized protein n=1 Tax=Trichinella pseudospiralis TaxID=6337 RepID=A0A0V1J7M0_TRIPS|nr:hypothetical protein T4B_8217 [Trichinella pseudospiralis]